MLVLSREAGERIVIGDDITVTILRIRDGVVRIGIDAPRATLILREEVIARAEEHADNGTICLGEEQGDAADNYDGPENPPVEEAEATAREVDGELTNDPARWEERSRPAPDWEIQEASEQGFQGGR